MISESPEGGADQVQPQMHQLFSPLQPRGSDLLTIPTSCSLHSFLSKRQRSSSFFECLAFCVCVCVCVCECECVWVSVKVRPPQKSWGNICFRLFIIYRSVGFETLQLFPFHEIHTLATWWEEPTHWERPWCWERLGAGEGGNRGWDGWMASPTQWTWVWVSSGRQWRTRKTGFFTVWATRGAHFWERSFYFVSRVRNVSEEGNLSFLLNTFILTFLA